MKKPKLFLGVCVFIWTFVLVLGVSATEEIYAWNGEENKEIIGSVSKEDLEKIRLTIAIRTTAVNQLDESKFLSTIDPKQQTYLQEEKRWFEDAKQVIQPGTFRLQIVEISKLDSQQLRVDLEQSYQLKKEKRREIVRFPTIWVRTKEGWKLTGLQWYQINSGVTTVFYSHPSLKKASQVAIDTIDQALLVLKRRYDWQPTRVEVKLYHQSEVFRQSVKPSLPRWAVGWHEANQAIKFVVSPKDPIDWLKKGLVHELSHQMVSELTHDNAAYWLQEGAAMYYENHLFENREEKNPDVHSSLFPIMSLKELENTQLERLPADEASNFYLSSYYWFKQMIEQKDGEFHMRLVWSYLRKYPYVDQDSEKKLALTNQRTREVMKHIPGFFIYWD